MSEYDLTNLTTSKRMTRSDHVRNFLNSRGAPAHLLVSGGEWRVIVDESLGRQESTDEGKSGKLFRSHDGFSYWAASYPWTDADGRKRWGDKSHFYPLALFARKIGATGWA